jgi:hypothetical protein
VVVQIIQQLKTLGRDICKEGFHIMKIDALDRLFGKYAIIKLFKYGSGFLVALFTALDSNFKVSHGFIPRFVILHLGLQ